MNKTLTLFFVLFLWGVALAAQNSIALSVNAFERHAEFEWAYSGSDAAYFQIRISKNEASFTDLQRTTSNNYLHFTNPDTLESYRVYIQALNGLLEPIAKSDTLLVTETRMTDEELMDMVQEANFRYFWDFAHPSCVVETL